MDIEKKIIFYCIGRYTIEQSGYYQNHATIEDFKVFLDNKNITQWLPINLVNELREDYLRLCEDENQDQ